MVASLTPMGAGASTDAPSFDAIDIGKWSKEQVAEEVAGMGKAFEEYKELVLDNNIDGETLVILSNEDLADAGVDKGLHRKQILAKIEKISTNQPAIKRSKPAANANLSPPPRSCQSTRGQRRNLNPAVVKS